MTVSERRVLAQQTKNWLQRRWGGRYRLTVVVQHAIPVELYVGIGALKRDYNKSSADYWSVRRGCPPRCSHNLVLQ